MALEGYLPDEDDEDEAVERELPGQRPGLDPRAQRRGPRAAGRRPAARRSPSATDDRRAGHARRRHRDRARPRPRRDRGDHELHEHLEPVGDARRRDPRAQRGPEGARGQAVGEDLARAGLEGRHRVPRARRPDRVPRRRSGSTSSATAARRASATPGRCRRRSRQVVSDDDLAVVSRAVGQPQLRGPDQPRREDELPRLAAAVRRLRAGRERWTSTSTTSRSARTRTASRSTSRTSGRPRPRSPRRCRRRSSRTCSARATREVFDGDERWNSLEVPTGRPLRVGRRLDLRAPPAVLRRPARASRSRSATSRTRACSPCSATASRPTTSRPPARSSATARRART